MAGKAAPTNYGFKLEGADRLNRILQNGEFVYKPVKRALAKIGQAGKAAARGAAPYRTGALRSSITYRVNTRKKEPRFVAISVRAVNNRRHSYPRDLEFNARLGHKGWLLRTLQSIRGDIGAKLGAAASDIEQEWKAAK